jgi:hypothetical protein
MNTVNVEVTDTFGGEANYAWVRRFKVDAEPDISDLALVRRAKREAGWSGIRCRRESFGETIALYPQGMCQVMFINE